MCGAAHANFKYTVKIPPEAASAAIAAPPPERPAEDATLLQQKTTLDAETARAKALAQTKAAADAHATVKAAKDAPAPAARKKTAGTALASVIKIDPKSHHTRDRARKKACRDGFKCTRKNCSFAHPDGRAMYRKARPRRHDPRPRRGAGPRRETRGEPLFPLELDSTDYLRRVLAQVTKILRPVYHQVIRSGHRPIQKPDDRGRSADVPVAEIDAYYVLKHVKLLRGKPGAYEEQLGQSSQQLQKTAWWLKDARNKLAHESLGGVSRDYLLEAFASARELAAAARLPDAQDELQRLKTQYEEHRKAKLERADAAAAGTGERGAESETIAMHTCAHTQPAVEPGGFGRGACRDGLKCARAGCSFVHPDGRERGAGEKKC